MKKITFILSLVLLYSCQDTKRAAAEESENSFFTTTFRDHQEIELLTDYQKVADTSIRMEDGESNYRLMKLRQDADNLIVFYKVVERDTAVASEDSFRALDTLQIRNLGEDERATIGYCKKEGFYNQEIIAVIKNNDSLYARTILQAWRANPESEEIEALDDLQGIECLNEFFESENATIPVEKMT